LTVEEGWSGQRTIALQTVGCKLNQAETESLAHRFLDAGYRLSSPDTADIYLLNTCTVTHVADHKCRKLARSVHRNNPDCLIAAVGCYAERAPDELSMAGVDLVVGRNDREHLVELVGTATGGRDGSGHPIESRRFRVRTRAMVKVQEGCSQTCTFCVVPSVRGEEQSRPEEEVIADVRSRVAEGHKEVILTGTRIGRYAHDGGLRGLVARVLSECDITRLRLSSLEPSDVTPALLRLWEDPRLCPHIHIPLQSGSDPVLKRMGRPYLTAGYERAVSAAREAIPDVALTTDIMVGFPGESEAEFDESYDFCRNMGFANLHVFPYSARPGTAALRLGDGVEDGEKKRRIRLMLNLAKESGRRFRERFLGRTVNVLWEGRKDGVCFGLTDNYLRVRLSGGDAPANELVATRLTALGDDGFWGTV
jgi:threonylcarbamoyladenosine tRNA methylthiotransferase MtaB